MTNHAITSLSDTKQNIQVKVRPELADIRAIYD